MESCSALQPSLRAQLVRRTSSFIADADPADADPATVSKYAHICRDDNDLPVTRMQVGAEYRSDEYVFKVMVPTERVPDGVVVDATIREELSGISEYEPSLDGSNEVTRLADLSPAYGRLADALVDVFCDGLSVPRAEVEAAHAGRDGPHLYAMMATGREVGFSARVPFAVTD